MDSGDKKFLSELKHSGKVDRFEKMDVDSTHWNGELRKIGEGMKWYDDLSYLGSTAVHIYTSPALGQVFYISQAATLGQTPEGAAAGAIMDLGNVCKQYYGRRPQRVRSGF